MAHDSQSPLLRLAVLNPGGRDREQYFPDGAGVPDDASVPHPPVNYHAYAACTGGSFHADTVSAIAMGGPVLLLLRRSLRDGWRCLQTLKAAGLTVAVTFKEAGAFQVAARLTHPRDVELLGRIASTADGCVAPAPWLAAFFESARGGRAAAGRVAFIPTPYPVDDPRWDFSVTDAERRGMFVGTREWGTPSRQHLAALWAARGLAARTGERVSVINTEGRGGLKRLTALGFSADPKAVLRVVPGPLPYGAYLREMACHKIVFQLDRSAVPGQVAGDALLCGVPCVGGDGAVEQLAFPDLCGHGRTPGELMEAAGRLLQDADRRQQVIKESRMRARERLSFGAVAGQLRVFFDHIRSSNG